MTSQFVQENDGLALSLPITTAASEIAQGFAQSQLHPQRAETVRRNTLAVCVVNDYCQMMAIPTDLESSDSWNPLIRAMDNVADLMLPGIGQLECRPVHPGAAVCHVPADVWDLRVGYVVVALDEAEKSAQLLGFVASVDTEELPLEQLQPLEDLIDRLYALQLAPAAGEDSAASRLSATAAHLSQWLNESFEAGWQAVEDLLSPDSLTPALGFRGEPVADQGTPPVEDPAAQVRRAKLIDVAMQIGSQPLVLVVEMQAESSQSMGIGLQVHPSGQPYLPPGLEMAVLESTDEVFMQVQARQADNYIQLRFTGVPGERFKVRLRLDEACYTEEFVV